MILIKSFLPQIAQSARELEPKISKTAQIFFHHSIENTHPQATVELDRLHTASDYSSNQFPTSFLMAFVFMNVCNHLDDACETRGSNITSTALLNHEVSRGVYLTSLLAFLAEAANVTNTPTPSAQRLNEMIKEQQHGMTLVAQSKQVGKIAYSLDQAIQYRIKTLGNYFSLIAELGLTDRPKQLKFAREMMAQQMADDKQDVYKDRFTQVNPYNAILHSYGLIEYLTNPKITYDTIVQQKNVQKDIKLSDALWIDEQRISDAYQRIQ